MSGKRYTPEEIISKLREAEVFLAEGVKVGEVIRRLGVNKITYYRWRQEYGGMKVEQAKRLKDLEKENVRLKRLLADAELDKAILKEIRRLSRLSARAGEAGNNPRARETGPQNRAERATRIKREGKEETRKQERR